MSYKKKKPEELMELGPLDAQSSRRVPEHPAEKDLLLITGPLYILSMGPISLSLLGALAPGPSGGHSWYTACVQNSNFWGPSPQLWPVRAGIPCPKAFAMTPTSSENCQMAACRPAGATSTVDLRDLRASSPRVPNYQDTPGSQVGKGGILPEVPTQFLPPTSHTFQ